MSRLRRWSVFAAACLAAGLPAHPQDKPRKSELTARIDQILDSKWSRGAAAPLCDDGEFLRRLSLDLRGSIPGEQEAREFLAGASPARRLEKIEEYLASPEYALLWSRVWADALFPNYRDVYVQSGKSLVRSTSDRMMKKLLEWMAQQIGQDAPMTKILADLLEAYGRSDENPLILYKLSFYNGGGDAALEFADGVSKSWLGVRVSCARCHDHPFDDWKQEHFYGLASFFARQRVRHFGGAKNDECDEVELSEDPKAADLCMPDTGRMMPPTFLYGGKAGTNEPRMTALANLMTANAVRQLPRAVANRVWAILMGRGLVNPVDDFNRRNRAVVPDLLEALTREFAGHRFSLKHLLRGICASRAYQLSSAREGEVTTEDFSRHMTRQLRAEALFNSLLVATRGPEVVQKRGDTYRQAWEPFAGQLGLIYGPGVPHNEVTVLPGNTRQALMLRNSDVISRVIQNSPLVSRLSTGDAKVEERIETAFLCVMTRPPREAELRRWADHIRARDDRNAYEDLVWTLINTSEFSTRH